MKVKEECDLEKYGFKKDGVDGYEYIIYHKGFDWVFLSVEEDNILKIVLLKDDISEECEVWKCGVPKVILDLYDDGMIEL